jgi:hypothetical protein
VTSDDGPQGAFLDSMSMDEVAAWAVQATADADAAAGGTWEQVVAAASAKVLRQELDARRPARHPLKDGQGRLIPGAMFTSEIRAELADPATDAGRRTALEQELLVRQRSACGRRHGRQLSGEKAE